MTVNNSVSAKQIYEQARQLSPENLADLAQYVEFLRFRAERGAMEIPASGKLRVVKLRGALKGYDFSPELLAEARREMWQGMETLQS